VANLVPGKVQIAGDHVVAVEAAFQGGPGIVVIAGTGSIAHGRNVAGESARAGGWGYAVSDEGSGHWIGRAAVMATLRALDEGKTPAMLEILMQTWGVASQERLVMKANATPPDFGVLVPAITSAADAGDPLARDVLAQAGAELATLARIVLLRHFAGVETVPVAMSGGVFRNCPLVREVFYNVLQEACPHARVQSAIVEPVLGALALARKLLAKPDGRDFPS
jgi:N-acetylglucosamine kinase-like BadF-type ATPase